VVKIGKNTEGGIKSNLNKKAVLTKKKIKKKPSWNTALPPTRRQKPTLKKPNGGGYAAVQTFSAITGTVKSTVKKRLNSNKDMKIAFVKNSFSTSY
jgi:hypothetical protein